MDTGPLGKLDVGQKAVVGFQEGAVSQKEASKVVLVSHVDFQLAVDKGSYGCKRGKCCCIWFLKEI